MDINEKDLNTTEISEPNNVIITPVEDQSKLNALDALQDDIVRNDTIPETSKDTPGSNGAFPVGAFDTSKDF